MHFNPVSGRNNFGTVKDPAYFKQQVEEMHASENGGFAEVVSVVNNGPERLCL
jgi:NAD(P)H dehydrogenase (quinone)